MESERKIPGAVGVDIGGTFTDIPATTPI